MKQLILLLVISVGLISCSHSNQQRTYKVSIIPKGIQFNLDINPHVEIQRRDIGFIPGDTVEIDRQYIQIIRDTL